MRQRETEGGGRWEGRGGDPEEEVTNVQIQVSDLLECHINGVVKVRRLADAFSANTSTIPACKREGTHTGYAS